MENIIFQRRRFVGTWSVGKWLTCNYSRGTLSTRGTWSSTRLTKLKCFSRKIWPNTFMGKFCSILEWMGWYWWAWGAAPLCKKTKIFHLQNLSNYFFRFPYTFILLWERGNFVLEGLACGQIARGGARGTVLLCNNTTIISIMKQLYLVFFLCWHFVVHVDLCVYIMSH